MEAGNVAKTLGATSRRARIEAKWTRRRNKRAYEDRDSHLSLVHDIRMVAWLFEKMHTDASTIPQHHMQIMQLQLLRKLAAAELAIIDLLGDPFQSLKGNS